MESETRKSWAFLLVSLGIIGCLSLQGLATFTKHWRFYSSMYPFLYYAMYSHAHYEGERIEVRYLVFATFEDSTEKEILPEDLGLNFWKFHQKFREAIVVEDQKKLQDFMQPFQAKTDKRVVSLRLEHYRLVLRKDGAEPAPPKAIKTVMLSG